MAEQLSEKRGISYPAINIEEAIRRAEQLWEREKKNAAPVNVVVQHWNYSVKSSGGRLAVAALSSYGLLASKGQREDRQVQLSSTALDIILNPIDSPDRLKAIQEAVRKPKIYSELMNKWDVAHLPSDLTMRLHLIKDKDFNPKMVDGFIKDFKHSIRYAKLDTVNLTAIDEVELDAPEILEPNSLTDGATIKTIPMDDNSKHDVAASTKNLQVPLLVAGVKQDVFALNEGNVILSWPEGLSKESFEDLSDWVELVLRKIKRNVEAADK